MTFKEYKLGLYYYNAADSSNKKINEHAVAYIFFNTVDGKKTVHTARNSRSRRRKSIILQIGTPFGRDIQTPSSEKLHPKLPRHVKRPKTCKYHLRDRT